VSQAHIDLPTGNRDHGYAPGIVNAGLEGALRRASFGRASKARFCRPGSTATRN